MIAPTCITQRGAAIDDRTADYYLYVYRHAKRDCTYRQLVAKLNSDYSPAWWARYERGEMHLNRTAKNELRRYYLLEPLAPTVVESIAEMNVSPDADVWRIGDEQPTRIIALPADRPITIRSSTTVEIVSTPDAETVPVTSVTRSQSRHSLSIADDLWLQLNKTRQAANLTWREFLAPLCQETVTPPAHSP